MSASGRLEYKLPDASVNPYISHAAVLAAIADGLERGDRSRARRSPRTPTALGGAVPAAAADAGRRAGARWRRTTSCAARCRAGLYDAFVEYKTDEWERFCGTVTEWHREMYLRALP